MRVRLSGKRTTSTSIVVLDGAGLSKCRDKARLWRTQCAPASQTQNLRAEP